MFSTDNLIINNIIDHEFENPKEDIHIYLTDPHGHQYCGTVSKNSYPIAEYHFGSLPEFLPLGMYSLKTTSSDRYVFHEFFLCIIDAAENEEAWFIPDREIGFEISDETKEFFITVKWRDHSEHQHYNLY